MRISTLVICVWALLKTVAFGQTVIINEGFYDGDFTNNPTWTDPEGKHIVNGSNLLQLNDVGATSSDEAIITTPSDAAYGEWEALIQLGFAPSGSNLSRFYIVSDNQSMKQNINGYYIEIGGSDDEVSLYRQDGSSSTKIIDGIDGLVDSNPVMVRVRATRDLDDNWELFVDAAGGTSYTSQGTITDNTYQSSQFIGFLSDYTSTRSDLFEYDDIKVTKVNPPLEIQDVVLQDNTTIDIRFNLDIDPASIDAVDFSIDNGIGNPNSTSLSSSKVVRLSYNSPLPSNEYTLTVNNINDADGNTINPNSTASFTVFGEFSSGDVLINEFVYDVPANQSEFVELKNTTAKLLNLQNWQIGEGSGTITISGSGVILQPNDYVVISSDTTELFNIYGRQNYIETNLGSLNNDTDFITVLTSDGTLVDSLQYTSAWGGDDVSLERRSDTAPSIYKENFGNSPNPNGGTPGQPNEVADDITPPDFDNLIITDNQTLDLDFSERLENGNATNTINYTLDNGITINNAQQIAGDSVRLSLSSPLQNGSEYQLKISNQQDIFGNTAGQIDSSFTYYEPTPADSGDIFINEFTYDPPTGSTEYIELYNTSNKSLDLQNWTINDNTGNRRTITNDQFIVPPYNFVVLAPDQTLLLDNPGILLVTMGNNFPSLNNSGDDIVLRNNSGEQLDSLHYTSTFGGNNIAVERRTVNAPPVQANLGDAPNGFGTPGSSNQIPQDNTPPNLTNLSIQDNQTLDLAFSEGLESDAAANSGNYSLNNGLTIRDTQQTASDSVRISLSSPLQNGSEYQLKISKQQDIFGNTATDLDTSFTYFETSAADSGDIFINEFVYNPTEGSTEYIELYNTTSQFFDLDGWTINDNSGNPQTITNNQFIVPPDSFVVIAPDQTLLQDNPGIALVAMGSSFPSLNNSGDDIVLRNSNGLLLDSLTYTSKWGGNNIAMERRTTEVGPFQSNFVDAPNGTGTLGRQNQAPSDNTPPGLQAFSIISNQSLEFVFTEQLDSQSATNTDNYTFSRDITVNSAIQSGDTVRVQLSGALQNNTEYTATINGVSDLFGNTLSSLDTTYTYFEVSDADSGDVFINEFTYDPPEGSTEYIELFNPTGRSYNLNGWTINDNTGNRRTITDNQYILPPNSFVVIAPDQTLQQDHPNIALIAMGNSFPSLNNSGDHIVLRNARGQRLDSLQYSSAWGGNNVALERRTTDVGPFRSNFGNASNGFGTPGASNEIPDDTTTPDIAAFSIIDNQLLEFVFSEHLEKQSATDHDTYALSSGITIDNVSLTNGNTIRLNLSAPLENDVSYSATIDGLNDLFGKTLTNRDTTFTYFEVAAADTGDVFINEFTYDPPEGSTEYIEIANPTSRSFNLEGWTINDNTGNRRIITDQQFIIPPDSFVVIASDQTLLLQNPDIALIAISQFPSLNNGSDDIVLRDSTGQRLDSLTYNSDWGGEVALERRTLNVDPIQANFGNAPNSFGTPGRPNEIGTDNTPPGLESFAILGSRSLQFVYTEQVERSSATNTDNYTLSGGIAVNSVILAGTDTVRISLSDPLQNNTDYTASVNGINDPFGNTLTNQDTTFTYFEVSTADSGDVFINEFVYNPPSGQTEYIELFNPTNRSLNLQNWTINDNTGSRQNITENQYVIPPNSRVVIAPDPTLLQNYPGISLVTIGSRFPSLNNSGDDIVLRDDNGQLLDSLRYTSAWGGDEIALERRTIDVHPVQANFDDSPNGFGTPGSANEITDDDQPPVLTALRILDKSTFQLIFSESITGETATQKSNYSISPDPGIQLISAVQDTVTLFLSQELKSEQTYQVTVRGLMDLFGNTIAETNESQPYVQYSNAQPGSILINEFLYTRESAGDPEFVELFNPTDQNFDLSGWKIGDASGTATIDAGVQLRRGNYLVLTDNPSLANVLDNGVYLSSFPSLNDDEDIIYLQDDGRITIDSLSYSPAFGGTIDGKSAERKDPQAASNDPSNFATSTANNGSTPGAQNSVFAPDNTPPDINFARIFPNGDIEVRFSEFISLNEDLKFSINDQSLTVDTFDTDEGNTIFLNIPESIQPGTELTLVAENLNDVSGNNSSSAQISVAQLLRPGDVVINEILYDPISDSEDNRPDQSEYIELRNTRDYAVSLEGITLHDAADEDGEVRRLIPVSTRSKYIPAQGTALIYADEAIAFKQSQTAQFFELPDQPEHTLIRLDRSSLSLASTEDAIYLSGNEGIEIDSVFYDESWQNPNLVDTDGIALERISPEGQSNDESNWGSSTNERGGTPNSKNSIYQESGAGNQDHIGISFEPNPFSPDDDGTDDRLFINYKLGQSDYLITVTIYDRYGRKIRELADGKPAGFEGSLIWDGLKDNGNRNRIGIYIVIFEAFDSASGGTKTFKETVVLARRLN